MWQLSKCLLPDPGEGSLRPASDQARLASEVEVVFHCAATVRFDEDLSRAVRMNVGAVWGLVRLARAMKRLVSLVHVSTAYCHCQEAHIKVSKYGANKNRNIDV